MDDMRPDDVAARVAAWHNRHPLARRITPAQVQGLGWVALPFVQRPGAAPLGGEAVPTLSAPLEMPPAPAPSLRTRVLHRVRQSAQTPPGARAPVALSWSQRALAGLQRGMQMLLSAPAQLGAVWQAARSAAALVRARQRTLQAAFSEDFIAPLSPARAARWALRHGQVHPALAGQPVRDVPADPVWARLGSNLTRLYLGTAAIEQGSRRVRVLLGRAGPDGAAQVIGPRLLSPQRTGTVLASLALLALVLARPLLPPLPALPSVPAIAQWPGVPALRAALQRALHPQPADEGLVAEGPAEGQATEIAASAPFGPAASAPEILLAEASPLPPDDPPPEPVGTGRKSPWVRPLVAPLDDATKAAARQAVADLRAARDHAPQPEPPAPVPASAPAPAPAPAMPATGLVAMAPVPSPAAPPATAAPAATAQAVADIGPTYALTTRPLRTRAESEQVQTAVRALLASRTAQPVMVELMPVGDDWRVVCWPFTRLQDAQMARALLLARGLRLEPVRF
jgi:hypothetical protein